MKESLEQHLEKDRDEVRRQAAMIIRAHLLTFSAKYEPKKKAEFRFPCTVEKTRTKYQPFCYILCPQEALQMCACERCHSPETPKKAHPSQTFREAA